MKQALPMDFSVILIIISLSCLHIFSGPDHYLPFIALSRSRNWSVGKTILWTSLCGLGHIASAVVISVVVMMLGWTTSKISWLQNIRGNIAAWMLLLFGLAYTVWGIIQIRRNKTHKHFDAGEDGGLYVYEHKHGQSVYPQQKHAVTPWVMFVIFALAPNEPMIPLLSVLGFDKNIPEMLLFISAYTASTIAAMLLMVMLGFYGMSLFKTGKIEKYLPPIGGITILFCGMVMLCVD